MNTKYIADQTQMEERWFQQKANGQGSLGDTVIGSLCPEGKPVEGRKAKFLWRLEFSSS